MIAFLGMGLLGSNFVKALLKKGEKVQVWNRTASKAKALESDGAVAFEQVKDAVKGAKYIHLTLKDDASVDEVLAHAKEGFEPGAIIIDHTTTSVPGAKERTAKWKAAGFQYQHAPVFMGPQNAHDSTGFMLVSGDAALINSIHDHLASMTGTLLDFGDEVGKAAGMKLIGNSFLISFVAGLSDSLSLARALNISSEDALALFDSWNPANMLRARANKITSKKYHEASWELGMARKDTGLFIQSAEAAGTPLFVLPAIAKHMDNLIADGHGNDDWTIIGRDSVGN
ncbi:6-phosphogluconate dehydrogenase [Chitinophaga caeni]|uniref:6-phosphogluconate dehydrogenase n=1 Tax=Chitinophaga caeni TaxID=2029983 RepID=A0A291QXH2_9BACT|nr:NAD(P)-dependent oxidoreductase [Chitinophaga caeni]ATL48729.1 6-phosphogluconate dehydrogenase [Chitinophaga caeni]